MVDANDADGNQNADQNADDEIYTGTVSSWIFKKGFGFLTVDDFSSTVGVTLCDISFF